MCMQHTADERCGETACVKDAVKASGSKNDKFSPVELYCRDQARDNGVQELESPCVERKQRQDQSSDVRSHLLG